MRAGEKLKESKKKSKMASASSSSQRDWGKVGAATVLPDRKSCNEDGKHVSIFDMIVIPIIKKNTKQYET